MGRKNIGFIFLYTLLSLPLISDPLWDKALDWVERFEDVNPDEMVTESLFLNKKGEITKRELRKYRYDRNGEESFLYYAETDGEDISQQEIEKEKKKDQAEKSSFNDSPFDRDLQERLELKRLSKNVSQSGQELAIYQYKLSIPDEKFDLTGKIWLDAEEGYPVRQEFTLDPIPKLINKFSGEVIFKQTKSFWGLVKFEMNIDAGALMIRQRIHNTTSFIYNSEVTGL